MGWHRKFYLTALLKSSVVGFCIVISLTTFSQADGEVGGLAYCGQSINVDPNSGVIKFPLDMGVPENWSNSERFVVYQSVTHEDNKLILYIDTNEIRPELLEKTKRKGQYLFPCAILKDKASWKGYWLNDPAAKQRIKLLKKTHEKYMDCLYGHRKEINKLNKKVIEHTCKKRTRWKPPGFESVAEGEM